MSNYPPGVTDAEIDKHHGERPPEDPREAEWQRDVLEVRDKLVILKHRSSFGTLALSEKALECFDKLTQKWDPFQ